jgi:outer membrane receptor protein involved in Fe transport
MSTSRSTAGWAVLAAGLAAGDIYNDDERLDAKASYAINEHLQVFLQAQKLTDTKLRQYIGPQRDFITNDERLRRTFYAGVSAQW